MSSFTNKQEITQIRFTHDIQCYCPLGNDWYTNQITVDMKLNNVVPDYCEIDEFIRSLAGNSLIIEDVVANIYQYLTDTYNPEYVCVKSFVNDAKHMPVTVIKES